MSGGRHVPGSLQEGLLYGSEYGPTKRQVFIQRIVLLVQAAVVGIAVVGVSVYVGVHEADGMSSLCIGHWTCGFTARAATAWAPTRARRGVHLQVVEGTVVYLLRSTDGLSARQSLLGLAVHAPVVGHLRDLRCAN